MIRAMVIDYGSGNLRSAAKAVERAARDSGLDESAVTVTSEAADLDGATHIVLPGVGAFADCMSGLKALPGMIAALEENVRGRKKPFLGICVGMQLMAERGLEYGAHQGLGWIGGEVRRIEPGPAQLKIPHMGWNELELCKPHPVFDGLKSGAHAYFVHSYHLVAASPSDVAATTQYGGPIVAAIARANLVGTQFHPEKSQETGLRLIANFLRWHPEPLT